MPFSFKWFLLTLETSQQHHQQEKQEKRAKDSEHAKAISEAGEDREESTAISLDPTEGEILPGKEQAITVKFTPVEVREFEEMFRCK